MVVHSPQSTVHGPPPPNHQLASQTRSIQFLRLSTIPLPTTINPVAPSAPVPFGLAQAVNQHQNPHLVLLLFSSPHSSIDLESNHRGQTQTCRRPAKDRFSARNCINITHSQYFPHLSSLLQFECEFSSAQSNPFPATLHTLLLTTLLAVGHRQLSGTLCVPATPPWAGKATQPRLAHNSSMFHRQ